MVAFTLRKVISHLRYDPHVVLLKLGLVTESFGAGSPLLSGITRRKIQRYKLGEFFDVLSGPGGPGYHLLVSGHKMHDSINLYESVMHSSARTVLEFGSGVSTLVLAGALRDRGKGGKVHSVEADARWADVVTEKLRETGLSAYADVTVSTPRLVEHCGQIAASFDKLPDVQPDIIYVDGPDPKHVEGNIRGLTMTGLQFIVLRDVLLYEWALHVGARIIVDGRLHNFRFLKANLKRRYRFKRKLFRNINEMSLIS